VFVLNSTFIYFRISVAFLYCICTVVKGCTISVTFLYSICTVDKGCTISVTFLYSICTVVKGCTISVTFLYSICTVDKGCTISSFRYEVDEVYVLLDYYAAYSDNSLPAFRDR